MKLKIAQLAPPWIEVPPKKYGGTELIVSYLTEGLVKRGHDVTLFASGDSKTKAKLNFVFKKSLYQTKKSWKDDLSSFLHASYCFKMSDNFDIIHNHFNYYGILLSKLTETPVVTTYHGDLSETSEDKKMILKENQDHQFISISNSQRKSKNKLNFIQTIYNGINVDSFKFNNNPEDYIAWIGRITPKKGLLDAIKIAEILKIKLKIAAKIDKNNPLDVEFYKKKIKPLIDGKKVSYIGEINSKQKSGFLGKAMALINPILWNEPFGLVMIEAMACGTPVIAYDQGSVKEIIDDSMNGFIVKNIEGAVKSFKNIHKIKRSYCRDWVEEKFDKEKMIDEYEKAYYKLINKK
jgi:glycosyltransferase involved in cell wall biosynthesis